MCVCVCDSTLYCKCIPSNMYCVEQVWRWSSSRATCVWWRCPSHNRASTTRTTRPSGPRSWSASPTGARDVCVMYFTLLSTVSISYRLDSRIVIINQILYCYRIYLKYLTYFIWTKKTLRSTQTHTHAYLLVLYCNVSIHYRRSYKIIIYFYSVNMFYE